ncbi:unnamed protein product [Urochloa humidicola]
MFHQVCRTQKMQGKGRVRSTWLRVFYKQYSSTLVNSHCLYHTTLGIWYFWCSRPLPDMGIIQAMKIQWWCRPPPGS